VFLTAGLRAERITRGALPGDVSGFPPRPDFPEDTVVSVNPKLAAAWLVRDDPGTFTRLRASAGTGIRPPDAFEIAYTDNPSLVPERSRSVDAGVDQSLLGGLLLVEATGFYNSYDDLIIAVGPFNGSSRYQTDNISNARAHGVETAATGRLRVGTRRPTDIELRGSYTYLRTAILDVDLGSGAPAPFVSGDPLLRRPAHQFGLNLMVRSGRLQAFVDGGGRGRFTDVDPSLGTFGGVYEAAGYTTWSAGAAWRIVPALELYGRVTNLFDRTYEEALGFPALGRGAMVGLRVAAGR
jgi:outer membrane receptor protein involved in Fe transport